MACDCYSPLLARLKVKGKTVYRVVYKPLTLVKASVTCKNILNEWAHGDCAVAKPDNCKSKKE